MHAKRGWPLGDKDADTLRDPYSAGAGASCGAGGCPCNTTRLTSVLEEGGVAGKSRESAAKIFAKEQDLRGSIQFLRRSGGVGIGIGVGVCEPSLGGAWHGMAWHGISRFVSPSLLQVYSDPYFPAIDDDRTCCKACGEIGPVIA